MSVTISSKVPLEFAASLTGMAYGTIPPDINVSYSQVFGENGWTKVVPEKMDVKAFTKSHGYKPVREYFKEGYSCEGHLGSFSWVSTKGTAPFSHRSYVADLHTASDTAGLTFAVASKSSPVFIDAMQVAVMRLNSKVRDMDVNLAVSLAEASQASEMLADIAVRLARALFQVRRFQFKAAARTLGIGVPGQVSRRNSWSKNWLAYRYGWTPLYYDAVGIMVALHKVCNRPIVKAVNGYCKITPPARTISNPAVAYTHADSRRAFESSGVQWVVSTTGQENFVARAGVIIRYTNENLASLESLGLTNAYELIFELLPGSFIADWFVNIGDKIADMTSYAGKMFLTGYKTWYFSSRLTKNASAPTLAPPKPPLVVTRSMMGSTGASRISARYWVKREVLIYPPVVELQFRNGLNPKRLLDAIALLRGVSSKKALTEKDMKSALKKIERSKRRSKSSGNWSGSLR